MTATPELPPSGDEGPSTKDQTADFRWQALFQRAAQPLFLLNRQRRLLFVNQAWEKLTGLPVGQVRGLACTQRRLADAETRQSLARALCPPQEVLEGKFAKVCRPGPLHAGGSSSPLWDIEFFPVREEKRILFILGRITPGAANRRSPALPVPEKLVALRGRLSDRYRFDQLDGVSPVMRRVLDQVRLACQTRSPVLIVGEAGTGKQWLARTIHHQGSSGEKPFAALECAAIPEAFLSGILFADFGLLKPAGLGTLFFKEPQWLPRDMQARLCDWLEEPGADGPRLIAGCCQPLETEVQTGRLLEQLHCALATLVIALPPLRDRGAEMARLVERLLERLNAQAERRITGLGPAAWEVLQAYFWPGNLRELSAVLAGASASASGSQIDASDLPAYLRLAVKLDQIPGAQEERRLPLDSLLEKAERRLILFALKLAQGNKTRAAELLAIWRPRLLRRMEALGIKDPEENK
jgi:transcriptional regulator with PAS, ATPase and Fis domain